MAWSELPAAGGAWTVPAEAGAAWVATPRPGAFDYLVDESGAYLLDVDGAYLVVPSSTPASPWVEVPDAASTWLQTAPALPGVLT